jgi:glycosyltransferase involved in cell wall biosynthesis
MRYAMTGFLLRHWFHAISGNTSHAAHAAARLFHIDPEQIAVTYNGVEFGLLRPLRDPDDVHHELGLEAQAFVIGTAANLKPWKRIDRLLLAAKRMADERVRVLVIGDGVDRQRLEEVAARNGLESAVIFAGAKRHVADYLQVMDAFCLPSTGLESFGNAVVEAMGLGLPTVIFADGGGMLEHIDDGRNGFIVSTQSELERRLTELANDPDLRGRIGNAARDVRAQYAPERAAQAYRDLYEKALQA